MGFSNELITNCDEFIKAPRAKATLNQLVSQNVIPSKVTLEVPPHLPSEVDFALEKLVKFAAPSQKYA